MEAFALPFHLVALLERGPEGSSSDVGVQGPHAASPSVGAAPHFHDPTAPIKNVVPLVGVGLKKALEAFEEFSRTVPFMGGCRVEDHLRRERVQVGPEPALEAPPEVREDHYRGVVRLMVFRL